MDNQDNASPPGRAWPRTLHLRRAGTSVVVDLDSNNGPALLHWGAELATHSEREHVDLARASEAQQVSGGLDSTPRLALIPTASSGWPGMPGLEGYRDGGQHFSLLLSLQTVEHTETSAVLTLLDDESQLQVRLDLEIGVGGLFSQRLTLTNIGDSAYTVQTMQATFALPWDSTELLDTTGRHLRERTPQRRAFTFGTHVRESRRGRPGADATLLLACGQPGFGFERGLVHGVHVAWSGNHRTAAERAVTGEAYLTGGELYLPGEVTLQPGQELSSPTVYGSWGDGLDQLAHRFHSQWRARPNHPRRPRPITLNTWEAVYFDHNLDKLIALADAASDIGVERFVLDDGWFAGRRDDTAGLGDWYVDPAVWPNGLSPLIDHVHDRGMEFGLWVEPEMVNPDSELARAHPDWLLRARTGNPPSGRNQQVLNLANPDAYEHLRTQLTGLLQTYPIAYLKWDHNRDLVDAGSGPGGAAQVHAHTLAVYRLLDQLRADHPHLEIETCASGGARIDLGILQRTDRVWVSDNLDPLERLSNQRYTALVVPPEMLGTHVTSPKVHATGRVVDTAYSATAALFGHFGIEWDLTATDDATRTELARWVAYAKDIRPLIATGRTVNGDTADPSIDIRGIVSPDQTRAVYTICQTGMSNAYPPGRVRLPGLHPDKTYRVTQLRSGQAHASPCEEEPLVLSGRELSVVGVRPPAQLPQCAVVIDATSM